MSLIKNIEELSLSAIDVNVFFGSWPFQELLEVNEVVAVLKEAGIQKAWALSTCGIVDDSVQGNTLTLTAADNNPSLIPVGTINPTKYINYKKEINRCIKNGVKVFRFFPNFQKWPMNYEPFYDIVSELENRVDVIFLPVRDYIGEPMSDIGKITEIKKIFAETSFKIVIVGVSYGNLGEALAVLKSTTNFYLESSNLNSPDAFEVICRQVGAERVLYGSRTPFHTLGSSMLPLLNANIGREEKEAIFRGNAIKILGGNENAGH